MIQLNDVSKTYHRRGQEIVALRKGSLQIATGDYVAIVGPSGCGKTTLLSLMGGMLSPNTGQVLLGSVSLYDLSVHRRTQLRRETIGFIFQTFNLVPYLTAMENVQVPLFLSGMPGKQQRQRALELLERVGLGDRINHKPAELSMGQQQRVALARTVANQPPLILADEPTGNLDPESRARVLAFFDELHQDNRTIVMVTHDMTAAESAQRKIILCDGVIATDSTIAPLRAA
jgi:putative ABC transport system ATP-binding protein